jgi:hypothetical protein
MRSVSLMLQWLQRSEKLLKALKTLKARKNKFYGKIKGEK